MSVGDTITGSHISFQLLQNVVDDLSSIKLELKESNIELAQVEISRSMHVLDTVSEVDVTLVPVTSSQEILKRVPGLFIGQHAGGVKA